MLFDSQLDGTARYAGFLLAPVESFGSQPRFFCPLGINKKKYLVNFWGSVVTSVTFRSNLSSFEKNLQNLRKTVKKIQ